MQGIVLTSEEKCCLEGWVTAAASLRESNTHILVVCMLMTERH